MYITTLEQSNYFNQSKWLVLTSCSFLIPALYAYYINLYFYSILLIVTTIVSINHWIKPYYSWMRTADLIVAKFSFTIFAINGLIYVKNMNCMLVSYLFLNAILLCYYYSLLLYKTKNHNWYKYHMTFHVLVMFEQLIVLYSIHTTTLNEYTIINCYKII